MSEQKTVAVLVGSLRKDSLNRKMANALITLAPASLKLGIVEIGALPLFNQDFEADPPAPVTEFKRQIAAADAVLFVTPEYNRSVPGVLKNAIDWVSRVPNQPFANKPICIQSASMGPLGGARMQYHLRQIFVFLDAQMFNRPEVMVGMAQNKIDATGTITDKTTSDFIAGQLKAFAEFVRRVS